MFIRFSCLVLFQSNIMYLLTLKLHTLLHRKLYELVNEAYTRVRIIENDKEIFGNVGLENTV